MKLTKTVEAVPMNLQDYAFKFLDEWADNKPGYLITDPDGEQHWVNAEIVGDGKEWQISEE